MLNEIQDQELEKIALNQQTATGTLYMHGDLIVALSAFNATEAFADKGTRVWLQKWKGIFVTRGMYLFFS